MRRFLSIFSAILLSLGNLYAVRAVPYPVTVTQPDGRRITLLLKGDEFFRYATTLDGRPVRQDRNGFFIPAGHIPSAPEILRIRKQNQGRADLEQAPIRRLAKTGSPVRILVIPVQFADVKFTAADPTAHFDRMLNQPGYSDFGGTGSAREYFLLNLPDREFLFDVTAPVTLKKNQAYYGANDDSTPSVIRYDIHLEEMMKEACSAADGGTDFSKYDHDRDGSADYIFFYLAGYNEAESGDARTIWPQTLNLSRSGLRFDGTGIRLAGCSSELSGSENSIFAGIGTFCHEFSHFLGLKDLYDVNYEVDGKSKCLWGDLSVMDTGNYNNNGRTPPCYCAIDRELAGTADYLEAAAGDRITLEPLHHGGKILRLDTANEGEYFLMENRYPESWDRYIGGSGMIICHIDKSLNPVDGIQAKVRWENNLINTCPEHECADLVEAFEEAIDISQVFFPGQAQVTAFSATTCPSFTDWKSEPVGFRLDDIVQQGQEISFLLDRDSTELLMTPSGIRTEIFQRSAKIRWSTERDGQFLWGTAWGETESSEPAEFRESRKKVLTIEGLEPKKDYFCDIWHIGKYDNGDTLRVRFTTRPLTSPYVHMEGIRNTYSVGDTLRLVIGNLSEEILSEEWKIDGKRIPEKEFRITDPGEHKIVLTIRYASDKSTETLIKNISVK